MEQVATFSAPWWGGLCFAYGDMGSADIFGSKRHKSGRSEERSYGYGSSGLADIFGTNRHKNRSSDDDRIDRGLDKGGLDPNDWWDSSNVGDDDPFEEGWDID